MTALFQLLISGVLLGGIYALAAFGLGLIFGVSNILNLAHGEFLMLGALVCFLLGDGFGVNPFVSLLILVPLFFVLGVLLERGLLRIVLAKAGHEQLTASVLVTLGLSLFLEDVARFLWGAEEKGLYYSLPPIILGDGEVIISSVRLLALGCVIVVTLAVHQFLMRTYWGKAIRAATQSRRGALLVGVNIFSLSALTWGMGAALAAIAGSLLPHVIQHQSLHRLASDAALSLHHRAGGIGQPLRDAAGRPPVGGHGGVDRLPAECALAGKRGVFAARDPTPHTPPGAVRPCSDIIPLWV